MILTEGSCRMVSERVGYQGQSAAESCMVIITIIEETIMAQGVGDARRCHLAETSPKQVKVERISWRRDGYFRPD